MTKWHHSIPWLTTIASLTALIVLGIFLILNIEWFKDSVFDESIAQYKEPEYRFYAYHMHLSMIKRSVALFAGFALMLIGMSAVFYTLKEKVTGEIKSDTISGSLATASPGIVAIIAGCYMIVATVQSKDDFPMYQKSENPAVYIPTPPKI